MTCHHCLRTSKSSVNQQLVCCLIATLIVQANYSLTRTFRKQAGSFRICLRGLSDYCRESPQKSGLADFPKWRN